MVVLPQLEHKIIRPRFILPVSKKICTQDAFKNEEDIVIANLDADNHKALAKKTSVCDISRVKSTKVSKCYDSIKRIITQTAQTTWPTRSGPELYFSFIDN